MTGPAGQPTQAVFGIFRDLLNLVKGRKPDYLAAAFDGAGPVFRSDLYRGLQGQPLRDARRSLAPDPGHPPRLRGIPRPRADRAGHGGRRRHRHAGPPGGRAGARGLHRHRRQGRSPVDRRPRPAAQPPDPQGDGRRGPGEGLGHPPRAGGRLPGPDRRLGGQRPGRPGDRPGIRVHVPEGVRHTRRPAGRPRRVKGPKKQQALREHAETARLARATGHAAHRLTAPDRLGRTQAPAARSPRRCWRSAPNAASMASAPSSARRSPRPAPPRRRGWPITAWSTPPSRSRPSWRS